MNRSTTAPLFAAAGAALALAATPALAQGEGSSAYDGLYVGVAAGGSIQENDRRDRVIFDTDLNGSFADTVRTTAGANAFSPGFCNGYGLSTRPPGAVGGTDCRRDKDGREFAGRVGWDGTWSGHFVAGVVLEGSTSKARDFTSAFSTTPAVYIFSRGLDYAISARGRFGFTPDGNGLFYVTGGPSYGKLKHRFTTTNTVNSFSQTGGDSDWGFQFGGGAEYTLANGLGVGLEYMYQKYDDKDYFVAIGPGTAPATNPFRTRNPNGTNFRPSDDDFDFHSIRATLTYHFRR